MNTRKVLPEVKGGGERKRVLWFEIIELVESRGW